MVIRIGLVLALLTTSASAATVPLVLCPTAGEVGPQTAPNQPPRTVDVSPAQAAQLAYFQPEDGPGVLAPRGWHCLDLYGSNGDILLLTPEQPSTSKGFAGPAIQVTVRGGNSSGRFDVARLILRYFPSYRKFADTVRAEGQETIDPAKPYPNDKLLHQDKRSVETLTPAHAAGFGTASRLLANDQPIHGLAMLVGGTPDLLLAQARLPPAMAALIEPLFRQLRQDYSQEK